MGIKSSKVNKIDLLRSNFISAASKYMQKKYQNLSWEEGQFTSKYYRRKNVKFLKAVPISWSSQVFLLLHRHALHSTLFLISVILKRIIYTAKPMHKCTLAPGTNERLDS